jgi:hypothetical protein
MTLMNGSLRPLAPAGRGAGFFSGGALSATVAVVFTGVVGLADVFGPFTTAAAVFFALGGGTGVFFSAFVTALVVLDVAPDAPFLLVGCKVPVATCGLPVAAVPALPVDAGVPAEVLLTGVFALFPELAGVVVLAEPLFVGGLVVDGVP